MKKIMAITVLLMVMVFAWQSFAQETPPPTNVPEVTPTNTPAVIPLVDDPEVIIPPMAATTEKVEAKKEGTDWIITVGAIIAALWTIFKGGDFLTKWRRVQALVVSTTTNEKQKKRALIKMRAAELMQGAVTEIYDEYVREAKKGKADGKLTNEERAKARGMAINRAVKIAKDEGWELLKEFGLPHLKALAEQSVSWAKNKYAKK